MRVLGNPEMTEPNKLIVLHRAKRLGLKVPAFEVLNCLSDRHLSQPHLFVTKAISDGIYLWDLDEMHRGYFSYTEDLAEVIAAGDLDEFFPLSLIQEKVTKSFEVRSFYLDGTFASAAIYSQSDAQTATDYRKYNPTKPNRNVPMRLPDEVAAKLAALFDELGLNTGSVDMIVDAAGDFVLLEINPVGIWGNLSTRCNYNIDEAVAKWLAGKADDDWRRKTHAGTWPNQLVASGLSDHLLQGDTGGAAADARLSDRIVPLGCRDGYGI